MAADGTTMAATDRLDKTAPIARFFGDISVAHDSTGHPLQLETIEDAIVALVGVENVRRMQVPPALEHLFAASSIDHDHSTVAYEEAGFSATVRGAELKFARQNYKIVGVKRTLKVDGDEMQVASGQVNMVWPDDADFTLQLVLALGTGDDVFGLEITCETHAASRSPRPATLTRMIGSLRAQSNPSSPPLPPVDLTTLTCSRALCTLLRNLSEKDAESYLKHRLPATFLSDGGLLRTPVDPERSLVTAQSLPGTPFRLAKAEFAINENHSGSHGEASFRISSGDFKIGPAKISVVGRASGELGDVDFAAVASGLSKTWSTNIHTPYAHPDRGTGTPFSWRFTAQPAATITEVLDAWRLYGHAPNVDDFTSIGWMGSLKMSDLTTTNAGFCLTRSSKDKGELVVSEIFASSTLGDNAAWLKDLPPTISAASKQAVDKKASGLACRLTIKDPFETAHRRIAVSVDAAIHVQTDSPGDLVAVEAVLEASSLPNGDKLEYRLSVRGGDAGLRSGDALQSRVSVTLLMKTVGLADEFARACAVHPAVKSALSTLQLQELLVQLEAVPSKSMPLAPTGLQLTATLPSLVLAGGLEVVDAEIELGAQSGRSHCTFYGFIETGRGRLICSGVLPQPDYKGYLQVTCPLDITVEEGLQKLRLESPTLPDAPLQETLQALNKGLLKSARGFLEIVGNKEAFTGHTMTASLKTPTLVGLFELVDIEATMSCFKDSSHDNGGLFNSFVVLRGSLQEEKHVEACARYDTSDRRVSVELLGSGTSLASLVATKLKYSGITENPLWKLSKTLEIEKFTLVVDGALLRPFSITATFAKLEVLYLGRLEIRSIEISAAATTKGDPKTNDDKPTFSGLKLRGVGSGLEDEQISISISSDSSISNSLVLDVSRLDGTPVTLKNFAKVLQGAETELALPHLPQDASDIDFMTWPISSQTGAARLDEDGRTVVVEALSINVDSGRSTSLLGDGKVELQHLTLKVEYTRIGSSDSSPRLALLATLPAPDSSSKPLDLHYERGRFYRAEPTYSQNPIELDVDMASALREACLKFQPERGELVGLAFDRAVLVRLTCQFSISHATKDTIAIDVHASFDIAAQQNDTSSQIHIAIDISDPIVSLEVARVNLGAEYLHGLVTASLPQSAELAERAAGKMLEQPQLATQLISVMDASAWSNDCILTLVRRGISPENVWSAMTDHVDGVADSAAAWLKGVQEASAKAHMWNTFLTTLGLYGDVAGQTMQYAKTARETLQGLERAIQAHPKTAGGDLQAIQDKYEKLKKTYEETIRAAQVEVERMRLEIRNDVKLVNALQPSARFSPKDGFVSMDWSYFRYHHFLQSVQISQMTWEYVVSPNEADVPSNELFDASEIPGYGSRPGKEAGAQVQQENLRGVAEAFAWVRGKWTHYFDWGSETFVASVWGPAAMTRVDDDVAERFKTAFALVQAPVVSLYGPVVQVDWTAAVPSTAKDGDFKGIGEISWEVVISPISDPAGAAACRFTEGVSNTKAKISDLKFRDIPGVFVQVRACVETGTPGFQRLLAPATMTSVARRSLGDTLKVGESLGRGDYLTSTSADGKVESQLILQDDYNFVLYHITKLNRHPAWATNTRHRPVKVTMEEDGSLGFYDADDRRCDTINPGNPEGEGASLVVQSEGNALIASPSGTILWQTNTKALRDISQPDRLQVGEVMYPGQKLVSPNGKHTFDLQGDGNLVLYKESRPEWSNRRYRHSAARAELLDDDNFVVYYNGSSSWESNSRRRRAGGRGALILRDDGDVVLQSDGTIIWSNNEKLVEPYEPVDVVAVQTGSDRLRVGEYLEKGQSLTSPNGRFTLAFQSNGNLVLSRLGSGNVVWASETASPTVTRLCFGIMPRKLVLYGEKAQKRWDPTRDEVSEDAVFRITDDGNLSVSQDKAPGEDSHTWWSSDTKFPADVQDSVKSLKAGECLAVGQGLRSANKQFELSFNSAGEIRITSGTTVMFSVRVYQPSTEADSPQVLSLAPGGYLELRDRDSTSRWKSGRSHAGTAHFILTDQGEAYVTGDPGNKEAVRWVLHPQEIGPKLATSAQLFQNQMLVSPSGSYILLFQTDGNLVLYERPSMKALWSTKTDGADTTRLIMQDDGNLVLYKNDRWRPAAWATGTNVSARVDRVVELLDDGNVVMWQGSERIWTLSR